MTIYAYSFHSDVALFWSAQRYGIPLTGQVPSWPPTYLSPTAPDFTWYTTGESTVMAVDIGPGTNLR